jgi:hypothetical protein
MTKYPVYNKSTKPYQRSKAKRVLRALLAKIETKYAEGNVSESEHVEFIVLLLRLRKISRRNWLLLFIMANSE